MSDQVFINLIGSTIQSLSSSSSSFVSLSSSLDSLFSFGKKIINDVEDVRANNIKLIEISKEIDNALKIIEAKVKDVSDRENTMAKIESDCKEREEKMKITIQGFDERERLLNEREINLNERQVKLEQQEKDMVVRDIRIKYREVAEKKIKECVDKTPNIVRFNVGGDTFEIEKSVIMKNPDSLLGVLVTRGDFKDNSTVYIDRDPSYFPVVINHLRGYKRQQDTELMKQEQCVKELDFYKNNNELLQEPVIFPFANELLEWVPSVSNLLYKGSRDGMAVAKFHELCDNKGPTLCILQTKGGYLFGGYAADSWISMKQGEGGKTISNPNTFIFTLHNPHGIPPTKYFLEEGGVSMIFFFNYGIWFGGEDRGKNIFVLEITVQPSGVLSIQFPTSFGDTTGKGSATFAEINPVLEDIFVFSTKQ